MSSSNSRPTTAAAASARLHESESPREPASDDFLDALRNPELVERNVESPDAVALDEASALGEVDDDLLDEERIPFSGLPQKLGQAPSPAAHIVPAGSSEPLDDRGNVEPVKVNSLDVVHPP